MESRQSIPTHGYLAATSNLVDFNEKKTSFFSKFEKNLELLCNLGSKCLVGNCDCWGKSKGWKKVEQHHVTFGSDIHKKTDQKSRFVW